MKIGFFTDSYYPWVNGVTISVQLFATELEKLGHEVYIFCPGNRQIKDEVHPRVIRFRSAPSIWHEEYRDTFPWVPQNIKRAKAIGLDIVHVHTPAQIGLFGMRIAHELDIPVVMTYHTDIEQYSEVYRRILLGFVAGSMFAPALMKNSAMLRKSLAAIRPDRPFRNWDTRVIRRCLGLLMNNCDLVIAPSQKMADLLRRYRVTQPTVIIPTGVEADSANNIAPTDVRKKYGISTTSPLLIFIGRLGEEKNVQTLIAAMPKILKLEPSAHLLIVGDGPHREGFEQQIMDLHVAQQITLTGLLDRPHVYAALKASDIFVFPSFTDTQGLVINEAAISGLPLVFVDEKISSLNQDKKTGRQAKKTAKSLAEQIVWLIRNPEARRRYGAEAKRQAKQMTVSIETKRLADEYKKLITKPKH